jgi:hypothetical protein
MTVASKTDASSSTSIARERPRIGRRDVWVAGSARRAPAVRETTSSREGEIEPGTRDASALRRAMDIADLRRRVVLGRHQPTVVLGRRLEVALHRRPRRNPIPKKKRAKSASSRRHRLHPRRSVTWMMTENAAGATAVNAEVDTAAATTATMDVVDATAATATTDLDLGLERDSAVEAIENANATVRAPDRGLATDAISAIAEITVSCCNIFRFFLTLLNKTKTEIDVLTRPQCSTHVSPDIATAR